MSGKHNKYERRIIRRKRIRKRVTGTAERPRLSVYRSSKHIYAQIIAPDGGTVVASASTLEKDIRKGVKSGGNVEAATIVGARIAEKAKEAGIDTVAFDRSGFRYHGRVKALAEAAREAGLKF